MPDLNHTFRSDELHVPGIVWPVQQSDQANAMASVQYQLEKSQWLSASEIQTLQLFQLEHLLEHAVDTVPFYQQHYRELNLSFNFPLSMDRWLQLPVLTREQLQHHQKELLSAFPSRQHGLSIFSHSSGSTGMPVYSIKNQLTDMFWQAMTLRGHLWHERDLHAKFGAIRYTDFHDGDHPTAYSHDRWGEAAARVFVTGEAASLSIYADVAHQTEWIKAESIDYLLTYPSNLKTLLYYWQENNNAPKLKQVMTFSEQIPEGLRELSRQVLGMDLVDGYSCGEVGYLALQCPEHSHYHIMEEDVFMEVLNEQGQPCAPGETGKVVVTDLHNFSMPLIRYEIGDLAEVGHTPCSCGRGLKVLNKIMGRYRNIFLREDGTSFWPLINEPRLRGIAPVKQFQIVQQQYDLVRADLVCTRELTNTEQMQLQRMFEQDLPGMTIKVNQVSDVPRSAAGKYEDFRSELMS